MPDLARRLRRVEWLSALADHLPPNPPASRDFALTVVDAEQLRECIRKLVVDPDNLVETNAAFGILDRLTDAVGGIVTLTPLSGPRGAHKEETAAGPSEPLRTLAKDYGNDSDRERKSMAALYVAATALTITAAALALFRFAGGPTVGTGTTPRYFADAAAFLALLVLAGFFAMQAKRHRIASQEARRLELQVSSLDAYLAPLPSPARDLLRAAMLQRLFPRLLDDDDPVREPQWPDPELLSRAMYASQALQATTATSPPTAGSNAPIR
jgi:hypothetical protein